MNAYDKQTLYEWSANAFIAICRAAQTIKNGVSVCQGYIVLKFSLVFIFIYFFYFSLVLLSSTSDLSSLSIVFI